MRIDPALHGRLKSEAHGLGVSLNEYCASLMSGSALSSPEELRFAPVIARAMTMLGSRLVGVAVFGSWPRGEATQISDIDLLIVVTNDTPLKRSLYREWDQAPVALEGHTVEPQFVRLPAMSETSAGIWGEMAVDAIVLFDRGYRLSRYLAKVRRDIVDGRIVRKQAHGQAYWVSRGVA